MWGNFICVHRMSFQNSILDTFPSGSRCFFLEEAIDVSADFSCICLWVVPPAAGQTPCAVPVVLLGADPSSKPHLCSGQCLKWSVNPTPGPRCLPLEGITQDQMTFFVSSTVALL